MRRWTIALFILGVSFLIVADDGLSQGKADAMPMTITYFGQSFFILSNTKGKKIAFDPHTIPDYQRVDPKDITADIVCISHNHPDHTQPQALKNVKDKELKILRGLAGPQAKATWATVNEQIHDMKIRNVGVFHDDEEGLKRGKNSVFIVEVDGWKICHLGDLGHLLTPAQLKKIGQVDVLMIPVGGIYTLNGADAKKVVDQIKPKEYVIPMHYGTPVFEDILTANEFMEAFPARDKVVSDDNVLKLNKDGSRPKPFVVQLHYWPKEEKEEKKDPKKDKK